MLHHMNTHWNEDAFLQWRAQAARARHRLLCVLSGEASWCKAQAHGWYQQHGQGQTILWVGEQGAGGCPSLAWSQARTWLGRELQWLIIDAHQGLDADGLAALSGTLVAGGVCLLLCPPLAQWPGLPDPQGQRFASWPHGAEAMGGYFIQRLIQALPDEGLRWQQGTVLDAPGMAGPDVAGLVQPAVPAPYAHAEQQLASAAIVHVVHGHRRRPLVLTADRGRGKSAALGIAAAQLLQQGINTILLSAPRPDAVAQVFAHAHKLLPGARQASGVLHFRGAELRFVAPDALLRERPVADLLLVDEAAAIPLAMLEAMLRTYSRVVFASTVHGYEGSGRGFVLRFAARLDQLAPGWQALRMSQPVRWAEGDPLERWLNQAMLLDAEAALGDALGDLSAALLSVEWPQRAALLGDEPGLRQLVGLLQLAHYRTSPNDLRQLLDAPDRQIALLRWRGQIAAAMLVAVEGGLPAELAEAVALGQRRLRGHLLPQSLAAHAGFPEAAGLRAVRVVRIVVHPACQGRGLGQALLAALPQRFPDADLLGASFGASESLLSFWAKAGFTTVRIGLRAEASSGAHALMVLKPCTTRAAELSGQIRGRFCQHLPVLLSEPLRALDPELVWALLSDCARDQGDATLDSQDWRELQAFAAGGRGYELCMPALRGLLLQVIGRGLALTPHSQRLWVMKVLQQQDWSSCAAALGMAGKPALVQAMREQVREFLQMLS